MRILQIDGGRLWRGGQRQCLLLCGHLAAAGCDVQLFCLRGSPLAARASGAGLRVHALGLRGAQTLPAVATLARWLRAAHPDLVAAHEARGLGVLVAALRLAGSRAPLVYHRRVDVPPGRDAFSRWKLARVDRFIAVSATVARVLRDAGVAGERIRVVHSGVPARARVADARATLAAELGIPSPATWIGCIAGLLAHKGHQHLLSACARLAPRPSAVELLLIGDGPRREALRRQAHALGIARQVHFLGERGDTVRLLSALDLFVLPSLTEGLGSSILDAFSLGVPVVATRAGGIPEIVVAGETGWLAPPGDAAALAAAMQSALDDVATARDLAAEARRRWAQRHSDVAMARATLACYRELLAPSPGASAVDPHSDAGGGASG